MMTLNQKQAPAGSLQTRSMLVVLQISAWTGRRTAKDLVAEAAQKHGAKADRVSASKYLIDRSALEAIEAIISAARKDHYSMTLPWMASGANVLSTDMADEYEEKMRAHQQAMRAEVLKLAARYPALVQEGMQALGTAVSADEYPLNIADKFNFRWALLPMPCADDFRLALGAAQLQAVRGSLEAEMKTWQAEAARSIAQRVHEAVSHMSETLKKSRTDKSGATISPIFRDTLVSNIADLVALIPKLNVMADPAVQALADSMQADLVKYSPEDLRASEIVRGEAAEAADKILSEADKLLQHVSDFI